MASLRTKLRKLIRRFPILRRVLRSLYRSFQYRTAYLLGRCRQTRLTVIEVDPQDIEYTVAQDDPTLAGNAVWHFGTVAGGDWDLNGHPINEHGDVYTILEKRVKQGMAFCDIDEFQDHLRRIDTGKIVDSCASHEEYYARWQAIEQLYCAIEAEGYRRQQDLETKNPLDEIRVQIGRRGELLFEEGVHRLAIAQLLQLERVPVIVTRRHKDWADLRRDVIRIAVQRGFVHQPFNHPDLDTIPRIYGNELHDQAAYGNDRWTLIKESLPVSTGSVLDIGAYFGYFAHRFETLGFECYALEPDPQNLAVLRRWRDIRGMGFTVWPESLCSIRQFDFDVVLALNIFHHLVITKQQHDQLVDFLRQVRCQAMYFEPGESSSEAYRPFTEREFVTFVLDNSRLTRARQLGRAREGRNVYVLTP